MNEPLCTILHISDFHFGAQASHTPAQAAAFLIEDIRRQYQKENESNGSSVPPLLEPDVCVVSGDLTATGTEYDQAEIFLDEICKEIFSGLRDRIFMVPGNHDIDWKISEQCYRKVGYAPEVDRHADDPSSRFRRRQVADRIQLFERMEELYDSRMRRFFDFYHRFYQGRRSFPPSGSLSYVISEVPDRRKVILVGFSTCDYVDHLNNIPSVNSEAILNSSRRLNSELGLADAIRIAVWHHGLRSDSRALDHLDQNILEFLSISGGFSLLLHGHLHKGQSELASTLANRILPVVGAGTLGAPAHERSESVPYQYNLVVVESSQVTVHSRKRNNSSSPWQPDFDWGGNGRAQSFRQVPLHLRASANGRAQLDPSPRPHGTNGGGGAAPSPWPAAWVIEVSGGQPLEDSPELRTSAANVIRRGGNVGLDDSRFLFGRFRDLQFVLGQVLIHRTNRCIAGPQWVGKTAFLQAICQPDIQRWVCTKAGMMEILTGVSWVYIDLRDFRRREALGSKSVERTILEVLARSLRLREVREGLGEIASALQSRNERLVLVLDHFEDALQKDELEAVFLNQLRARENSINVLYAMTSEARVPRLGKEKAHYFNAISEALEFFSRDEISRSFLEIPLRMVGISVDRETLDELVFRGGRHPFFLSLARQAYFDCVERLSGEAPQDILEAAITKFEREVPRLYDGLLARLIKVHHVALRSILENQYDGIVSVELQPFVQIRQSGKYVPFSEHFRRYYLESYVPAHAS